MKKWCLALAALVLMLSSNAQKDSSFIEVGVNTFRLVGLDRVSQTGFLSPYQLHIGFSNGRIGGRIGAGFYRSSETELPGTTNGNSEFTDDTLSMDIRLGLVLHRQLRPRWSVQFGADFFVSNRNRAFTTIVEDVDGILVETSTDRTYNETGGALFFFPQFHLTPRISLATELSLVFASTTTSARVTSTEFEDFNSEVSKEGSYAALRAPSSLFLIVRF